MKQTEMKASGLFEEEDWSEGKKYRETREIN